MCACACACRVRVRVCVRVCVCVCVCVCLPCRCTGSAPTPRRQPILHGRRCASAFCMRSRARRALSISLGTWLFEAVSAPSAPAARRRAAYVVASLLMLNLRSHGEQVVPHDGRRS